MPPLMDVAHIERPSSPNTALAAPQGFTPPPGPAGSTPPVDIITPPYQVPADRLFLLVQQVAGSQPRTYQAALYPAELQAHYVARSTAFNFPDLIMAQVRQDGPDKSDLILYSRSVYGESDFGVNRKRVETWLAALRAKLPSPSEK